MVFLIVLCHELGHAAMALFFRWRIKKIELLPFGGVLELDEHGNRPLRQEMLVILAGPLQHVWLLGVAFICYEAGFLSAQNFELFTFHNFMILFFNLLPIWPLDGGKLLFVIFSSCMPFSKAHRMTIITSSFILAILGIAAFIIQSNHLNMWMIFIFLLISLYTEWKQCSYVYIRFLLERYYGKHQSFSKLKPLVVKDVDQIMDVLVKFCRGYKHSIIILENNKKRYELDENELLHAYFARKLTTCQVKDLIHDY